MGGGGEETEIPKVLKNLHVEFPGVFIEEKWNFQGRSRVNHVECLGGLGFWSWNIREVLHSFPEFPGVKLCSVFFVWNLQV